MNELPIEVEHRARDLENENEVLRTLLYAWHLRYGREEGKGCRICSAAPDKPCSDTCLNTATVDLLAD